MVNLKEKLWKITDFIEPWVSKDKIGKLPANQKSKTKSQKNINFILSLIKNIYIQSN
jgi:hypothetical protein